MLSFKCLQFEISPSIQFLEGGNDKGRDIIYTGITSFFKSDNIERKYLFQVKHKSKPSNFSALKSDLRTELDKVFVKNKLSYDVYCLVTNLTINGNQIDELNKIFSEFSTENNITNIEFHTYSYRHFESCIDKNTHVKWSFPLIISSADFKCLLEEITDKEAKTISEGWINVFEKSRERFICTSVFDQALEKLKENKILLLSGPPKSGKTFNAEMILLAKFTTQQFIPYKIDTPEDFAKYYNKNEKQIFLFDDAFGRHDIEIYRADVFNRKLELIFELVDDNHNCIFTSREYIYKAFSNYADENVEKLITKINVEVNQLTLGEKESLLHRYFEIAFPDTFDSYTIYIHGFISHKKFSPETIRAYFDNAKTFNLEEFRSHLDLPDKYLEKLFTNLPESQRIILLSILLSSKGDDTTITYSFKNICQDLNKQPLIALKKELNLMEDSIIKLSSDKYDFYHPSMKDFFIRFLGDDVAVYRSLLFKNINIDILTLCKFQVEEKSRHKLLEVNSVDVVNIKIGFERLIKSGSISLFELNTLFSWFNDAEVQLYLKIKLAGIYNEIIQTIFESLKLIDHTPFISEDISSLSDYFNNIRLFLLLPKSNSFINKDFFTKIIVARKAEPDFWLLVFKLAPLVEEKYVYDTISKEWLNNFYTQLKNEIDTLGKDLYGEEYPTFNNVKQYHKLRAEQKYSEAAKLKGTSKADYMQKTKNDWYPKYKACKDKMTVLKASPIFGYKIYERLLENFAHLTALEDTQKNRYFFNVKKEWWNKIVVK